MTDFIEGENRNQATLFPDRLDDYITDDNAVRIFATYYRPRRHLREYEGVGGIKI